MQITERQTGDMDRLRRLIRRERSAIQRDRLRCVVLAIEGGTEPQITTMTGRSRGFVQRWAYAYRDGGIDAIKPAKRGGSRPRLSDKDTATFLARLRAGPDPQADAMACTLAGKDCQRILREQFGVAYSLNGVYRLLHRHGFSCLRPRPRHRKTDPDTQQRWLDDAPFLSGVSATNTPANTSRSGSKTRRGSVSKGP
jgi:putative transposase